MKCDHEELMGLLLETDVEELSVDGKCRVCGSGFYDGYYAISKNICCKIIELKRDIDWLKYTNRKLNRDKQALESLLANGDNYKVGFYRGRSQLIQELAYILAQESEWKINIYRILDKIGLRKSITKGMRYDSVMDDIDE